MAWHIFPWFWSPMKGWHFQPFSFSFQTQLRDFDAWLSTSTIGSTQVQETYKLWRQKSTYPPWNYIASHPPYREHGLQNNTGLPHNQHRIFFLNFPWCCPYATKLNLTFFTLPKHLYALIFFHISNPMLLVIFLFFL